MGGSVASCLCVLGFFGERLVSFFVCGCHNEKKIKIHNS